MSLFAAINHEIDDAKMLDRPVAWIRVSTDAIPGSVTTTPITPERARTVRLHGIRGSAGEFTVDADPEVWLRSLEIVVHPKDYMALLTDADWRQWMPADATHIMGVRVVR